MAGAILIGFVGIAFVQGWLIGGDAVARLSDTEHKGFELIFSEKRRDQEVAGRG